ncbi:MAG: type II secretion system protein N [Neptuniibacter sp.]
MRKVKNLTIIITAAIAVCCCYLIYLYYLHLSAPALNLNSPFKSVESSLTAGTEIISAEIIAAANLFGKVTKIPPKKALENKPKSVPKLSIDILGIASSPDKKQIAILQLNGKTGAVQVGETLERFGKADIKLVEVTPKTVIVERNGERDSYEVVRNSSSFTGITQEDGDSGLPTENVDSFSGSRVLKPIHEHSTNSIN